MAAYPLDVLIGKWKREELSLEQAIGQILLVIQKLDQRIGTLESRRERPPRRSASARRAKQEERGEDHSESASGEPASGKPASGQLASGEEREQTDSNAG